MRLLTEPYLDQLARWPKTGRHILAHFDTDSIVVYQAYNAVMGHFAARYGRFGSEFSLNRMTWIKPNFLWMMYRCGWGTKANQEVVLAIWLKRSTFDHILEQAVHSTFVPAIYDSGAAWKAAVEKSEVRLQWDPDHDPSGKKVERRAIQLGLRGEAVATYAREWILQIEDISEFVRQQHLHRVAELVTPIERVYPVEDGATAKKLQFSESES